MLVVSRLVFLWMLTTAFSAFSTVSAEVLCETGMEAYAKTLYPIQIKKCAQCHGDMGEATPHSVSDLKAAYLESKQLVDFLRMESSRFVRKVKSKHWLDEDSTAEGMSEAAMLDALTAWWENGENACPKDYQSISTAKVLGTLPNRQSNQFTFLEWDLGSLKGTLAGCKFRIEIQRFTEASGTVPGSFRVKNPAIQCHQALKVNRVRVLLNESTQAYENIYEAVNVTIPASTEFQALHASGMILIERSGQNQIQIAFGTLQSI